MLRTIAEKLCGKEKVEEVAKVGSVRMTTVTFCEFPGSFPTNVSPVGIFFKARYRRQCPCLNIPKPASLAGHVGGLCVKVFDDLGASRVRRDSHSWIQRPLWALLI